MPICLFIFYQDTTIICKMPPNAWHVKKAPTKIVKDNYRAFNVVLVIFASMNFTLACSNFTPASDTFACGVGLFAP